MITSSLYRLFLGFILFPLLVLCASTYDPLDITQLFPDANAKTVIAFGAPVGSVSDANHTYAISDYSGNVVAEGQANISALGELEVPLDLPAGYYEITFAGGENGWETGVWCRPTGPSVDDGFMSVDTAISWLTKPVQRPALIKNLSSMVRSNGMARERLSWNQINPQPGVWDWETKRQYDSTRSRYKALGIPVLEMFHSSPNWLGSAQDGTFPDDHVAVDDAWRIISQRWAEGWGALEVWNEPDIRFGGEQPSDQYVPIVKTIRYALRSQGIQTPIGGGVFSAMNPAYADLAASNGLLEVSDFISFHYYEDPLGLESVIQQYRDWLDAFGYGAKPLWMTEVGLARASHGGRRAPLALQSEMALVYAMQAVEARACGIERFFSFVFVDYSERNGSRSYGMQDSRGTPLRILAASSQAGYALGGAEYIGDLPNDVIPGVQRIRVFKVGQNKETDSTPLAMAAIYTGDATVDEIVTLPFEAVKAQGIDGRSLPLLNEGRRLNVEDGLVYVYGTLSSVQNLLNTDTQAMELYRMSQGAPRSMPVASSVVLQPQLDLSTLTAVSSSGYFLTPDCGELPLTVIVNNLGDESRMVSIVATGAPETTVTVGAKSRVPVIFNIDVSALPQDPGTQKLRLTVRANSDTEAPTSRVELVLIPASGLSEHLQGSHYQFALSLNEAYRWKNEANGELSLEHDAGAAYGFRVKFKPGVDRWAYPKYTLPQEVDQEKIDGVLVRARCLEPGIVRLLAWDGNDNMSMTRYSIIPSDGEWHVAYIPFDALTQRQFHGDATSLSDLVRVSKIAIGVNSEVDENGLEISDIYLIGK